MISLNILDSETLWIIVVFDWGRGKANINTVLDLFLHNFSIIRCASKSLVSSKFYPSKLTWSRCYMIYEIGRNMWDCGISKKINDLQEKRTVYRIMIYCEQII